MESLTGCRSLIRLIMRRDRYLLLVWILAIPLLCYAYAAVYKNLYPTVADRNSYFTGIAHNPALVAIFGGAFTANLGALAVQRVGVLFMVTALVSTLFTIRHTRAEEESGRREVVSAAMVGCHASLTAAMVVVALANLAIALLTALGQLASGLPTAGSFAFGLSMAAAGCMFMTVSAVAAQLTQGSGAARGIAIGGLAVAFLLRAAGDASGSGSSLGWMSWASPFGWVEQVRPFSADRWTVFSVPVVFLLVMVATAVMLSAKRDVGGGLIPTGEGPGDAGNALSNIVALIFRVNRGMLAGWTFGFALAGLVLGGIAKSASNALNDSSNAGLHSLILRMGGHTGVGETYLTSVMGMLGLVAAGCTVQTILRLHVEETRGRAEYLLATAQPRLRWAGGYLTLALVSPMTSLAVAGLTSGLAYGLSDNGIGHQLPRVMASAVIQLPAVWVLTGASLALFGVVPRLTAMSWAVLGACFLTGQVGAALQLSQTVQDLSPFTHIPKVLGGNVAALPLMILIAIALALIAVGLTGLLARDLGAE